MKDKWNDIAYIVRGLGIVLAILIPFFYTFKDNGFYASLSQIISGIIGGLLTLLGVIMTIKYEESKRKEDNIEAEKRQKEQFRLDNLPVFNYNFSDDKISEDGVVFELGDDDKNEFSQDIINWQLNINIKNIGLRSAKNIAFQVITDENENKVGKAESFLKVDDDYKITFYFQEKVTKRKKEESITNILHSLLILVYYDDLIGNHYIQELKGTIGSCTQKNNDKDEQTNFFVLMQPPEEYRLIENNYIYRIPNETIKLKNKREVIKKTQLKIEKLYKKKEIIQIEENLNNELKEIIDYIPFVYKKIKFDRGGRRNCRF